MRRIKKEATVSGSTFKINSANMTGGAIIVEPGLSDKKQRVITIVHSIFVNNKAMAVGQAIHSRSRITIRNIRRGARCDTFAN